MQHRSALYSVEPTCLPSATPQRINLVILKPNEIDTTGRTTLTDRRADHALNVLHARVGQAIRVGMLDGKLGTGWVEAIIDDRIMLRIELTEMPPLIPASISYLRCRAPR